jgi:hypothetical protein
VLTPAPPERETMRRAPLPRDPAEPPPVAKPLPPQPKEPPPQPPAPPKPAPTLSGISEGAPKFSAASPPAYWIWRSADGVWRLRTTTGNTRQSFHGMVAVSGDKLGQVSVTRTELYRRVDIRETQATFQFSTDGHFEGIDFTTVRPNSCPLFHLIVDGSPVKQIFIGANAVRPPSHRFLLCPPK